MVESESIKWIYAIEGAISFIFFISSLDHVLGPAILILLKVKEPVYRSWILLWLHI